MNLPPPVLEYGTSQRLGPAALARRVGAQGIIAILGVAIGLVAGWLLAPKPVYRALSLLQISSIPSGVALPPGTRALNPSEIGATGQKIRDALTTAAYRQRIVDDLRQSSPAGRPLTTDELAQILSVSYVRDTTLFKVEATDPSPAKAAQIANLAAREAFNQFRGTAPSVTVLSIATPPPGPSNDPTRFIVVAGIAGGVVLPVGIWLIRRRAGNPI